MTCSIHEHCQQNSLIYPLMYLKLTQSFFFKKFFSVSTVVRLSDEGKMEALIEMFQESYR